MDQICSKRVFPVWNRKVNITIEFYIFEVVQVTNFSLNWQFWFFEQYLPKGEFWWETKASAYHHWILHIWISLGTKFQLKLPILSFWTRFAQKGYFQSKNGKSERHHWILHIRIRLGGKFQLKLTILIFETKFAQ